MRVLIITAAILACTAAAPSGVALSLPTQVVALSSLPTISPGDIQAAAINAKVSVDDAVQAAADQAIEAQNEGIISADDLAKERSLEAFWTEQDRRWQSLDAVKTAEAQLDGATASNADAIAKSVITSPVVAAIPAIPAFTAQTLLTGFSQSLSAHSLSQTHPAPLANAALAEPVVKTAALSESAPSVRVADSEVGTLSVPISNDKSVTTQSLVQTHPGAILGPVAFAPTLKLGEPWLVPSIAFIPPELKSLGQQLLPAGVVVKSAVW